MTGKMTYHSKKRWVGRDQEVSTLERQGVVQILWGDRHHTENMRDIPRDESLHGAYMRPIFPRTDITRIAGHGYDTEARHPAQCSKIRREGAPMMLLAILIDPSLDPQTRQVRETYLQDHPRATAPDELRFEREIWWDDSIFWQIDSTNDDGG